jgi:hypothetical protein
VLAHVAAAGPDSLTTQHQKQQRFAGSRTDATDAAAGSGIIIISSTKPQSPLAKAKSSPLMKTRTPLGSSSLFSALQGGSSSARVLAAAAAARPGSGGSASTQDDASTQQQQQQLAALGFGIERFDGDLVKLLRCGGT